MGKLIVFWSPIHGQGGTSANAAAIASLFSLEQSSHSLLTHTQLTYSPLDSYYSKEKRAVGFENSGIQALERKVKSNLLQPEDIPDYTDTIYKRKMDLLIGSLKENEDSASDNLRTISRILYSAKGHYDTVWVDTHAGVHNDTSKTLLEAADLVVVCLPQNKYVLERFFTGDYFPTELRNKPYIILISRYEENSSLTVRNIKRAHKVKVPILPVPFSPTYLDAMNNHTVAEFFYRVNRIQNGDPAYSFIRAIRTVNESVRKALGLEKEEDGL
ncbi:hypothetical protein MKZ20_22065 [Psychrobacillus sp. FSL K6-2684]|uniref:hypothetical protein n=1 Tax=unclassified Psychrobacillus TaxID=2636677 RepID=UPI0030FAFEF2